MVSKEFFSSIFTRRNLGRSLVIAVLIISLIVVPIMRTTESFLGCIICLIIAAEFNIFCKYANFQTFTVGTFLSSFVAYLLAFSAMVVLPLDTANTITKRNSELKQDLDDTEEKYFKVWNVVYWGMFVLNNLVFKLQLIYLNSGYLSFWKRMQYTIKAFIKQIIILLVIFGILCLIVATAFKVNGGNAVKTAILVLAQVYGITVLVFLLGYGLVQFPFYFWSLSNREYMLDISLTKADDIFRKYREAQMDLSDSVTHYQKIIDKIPQGHELYDYVTFLKSEIPRIEALSISGLSRNINQIKDKDKKGTQNIDLNALKNISEDTVAQARIDLKKKIFEMEKHQKKWERHSEFIFTISDPDTLTGLAPASSSSDKGKNDKKKKNQDKPELSKTLITRRIKSKDLPLHWSLVLKLVSLIFLSISLIVIWQETTMVFGEHEEVLVFAQVAKSAKTTESLVPMAIFIMLCLFYIVNCAYFALFRLELGAYLEFTVLNTDAATMIKSSTIMTNLAFPLCYNLMCMFNEIDFKSVKNQEYRSGFSEFFNPMKKVPFFGDKYNVIVPLFVVLVGFFTIFKSFGNLINRATKGRVEIDTNEVVKEKVERGEKTIISEWERRKRRLQTQKMEEAQKPGNALNDSVTSDLGRSERNESRAEKPSNSGSRKESQPASLKKDTFEASNDMKDFVNLPSEQSVVVVKEMSGWLQKEASLGLSRFQKRYFVAGENQVDYYEKVNGNKKGSIEFASIVKVNEDDAKKNIFTIVTKDKKVKLMAESPEELKKWVDFFNYQITMKDISNI